MRDLFLWPMMCLLTREIRGCYSLQMSLSIGAVAVCGSNLILAFMFIKRLKSVFASGDANQSGANERILSVIRKTSIIGIAGTISTLVFLISSIPLWIFISTTDLVLNLVCSCALSCCVRCLLGSTNRCL